MMRLFRRKQVLTEKESDLGNVLLKMGAVSSDQLARAVEMQRRGEQTLLGSILVGSGAIDGETLGKALRLQEKFRTGKTTEAMCEIIDDATQRAGLKLVESK